jgi:hypothetical protein
VIRKVRGVHTLSRRSVALSWEGRLVAEREDSLLALAERSLHHDAVLSVQRLRPRWDWHLGRGVCGRSSLRRAGAG